MDLDGQHGLHKDACLQGRGVNTTAKKKRQKIIKIGKCGVSVAEDRKESSWFHSLLLSIQTIFLHGETFGISTPGTPHERPSPLTLSPTTPAYYPLSQYSSRFFLWGVLDAGVRYRGRPCFTFCSLTTEVIRDTVNKSISFCQSFESTPSPGPSLLTRARRVSRTYAPAVDSLQQTSNHDILYTC